MAGELLPDLELRYIGFTEERPSRDGWKDASRNLELLYRDHDRDEDTQMLVALMSIENVELPPTHQLEFLA